MWERLTEHWDELLDRFPVNSHRRMLDGVRTLCGDPALAEDGHRASSRRTRCASGQRVGRPDPRAPGGQRRPSARRERSRLADALARRRSAPSTAVAAATRGARREPRRHRHGLRPRRGGRAPGQDDDRHPRHGQPQPARCFVWLGASAAFAVHVTLAVVAGRLLELLPHRALEIVVTVLFLAGAVYLLFVPEKSEEEKGEAEAARGGRGQRRASKSWSPRSGSSWSARSAT